VSADGWPLESARERDVLLFCVWVEGKRAGGEKKEGIYRCLVVLQILDFAANVP